MRSELHTLWSHSAAAFSIGLFGSVHCIAMCSGLASAHSFMSGGMRGTPTAVPAFALAPAVARAAVVNLGRISQYAILALVAASLGSLIINPTVADVLRSAGAIVLVLLGLHIAGWSRSVLWLERAGHRLTRCGPRPSSHTRKARTTGDLVSGLLWGAMPCSLVYSTMIWAATLGHPVQSAAVMFAFGCGTLPSMILTGVAGRKLHGLMRQVRPLAGAALVLYGVVTFPAVQNLWMSHDEGHSHVQHGTQ